MKDFRRRSFLQMETYGHGQMWVREEQRTLPASSLLVTKRRVSEQSAVSGQAEVHKHHFWK